MGVEEEMSEVEVEIEGEEDEEREVEGALLVEAQAVVEVEGVRVS